MNAGERLKQLRKELNIPQSEIASLLNIAQQQISYYEKNGNIDIDRLAVIARTYDIDIRYFIEDKPVKNYRSSALHATGAKGPDIPVGWTELLEQISDLEYDKIKFIETVIRALLKEFSG